MICDDHDWIVFFDDNEKSLNCCMIYLSANDCNNSKNHYGMKI